MNYADFQLREFPSQVIDFIAERPKIQVTLLDQDNLPLARGMAALPGEFGIGFFWPNSPMPPSNRLAAVKGFILPTGETAILKSLTLCPGNPPRYEFSASCVRDSTVVLES